MLNCKPGDMAIVVRGQPDINHGRVVRVVSLRPPCLVSELCGTRFWLYEGSLVGQDGAWAPAVADNCLRPLRDDFEPESVDTDVPAGVLA